MLCGVLMIVDGVTGSGVAVVEVLSLPLVPVLVFSSFPLQEDKNNTAAKKDTGRNRDEIIVLILKS